MKKLFHRIQFTSLVAVFLASSYPARSQNATSRPSFRGRDVSRQATAEPFKGVTTNGNSVPGLFKIQASGVSTEPVRTAAEAYLASLSEDQRQKTLFQIDDSEWRKWDNRHFAARQGVGFRDMTDTQRNLGFDLFKASLSAKGLKKTRDIMRLNETLGELKGNFSDFGDDLYWITIMGKPSATKPWGWQLDGHHVIINYFVLGDQVVMTPTFMGSEPIRALSGKYKGTVVLQDEQNKGLALVSSLNESQMSKARIKSEKGPTDTLSEAYRDNLVLDYAGIRASELNGRQKKLLLAVINEYVANMKRGHAATKMEEVNLHLDQTYFAWIGDTDSDAVYYYRIHSPVILIEFDHQRPIGLGRSRVPTHNHIHTVVRTPNGNDYGKDLLKQHYEKQPHDH